MATRPLTETLQEYGRGIAGGLLFSLPLFYTMEVWWVGHSASPLRLLTFVVGTFALLLAYNVQAGLRAEPDLVAEALESVEEMGLGLLMAAGLLLLLGRISPGEASLAEALGKVIVEGMVAAIGVSVGTAQLGESPEEADGAGDDADDGTASAPPMRLGSEVAIALCGAVLVASNVAPTEEVLMLGVEMSAGKLLGVVALSLVFGAGLLYFSAFSGSDRLKNPDALGPVRGTVLTYAVALAASAGLLWVFGRFDGMSLHAGMAQVVVLGLPAMLGAAAGRLLLSPSSS